jgi:hypothetical protein
MITKSYHIVFLFTIFTLIGAWQGLRQPQEVFDIRESVSIEIAAIFSDQTGYPVIENYQVQAGGQSDKDGSLEPNQHRDRGNLFCQEEKTRPLQPQWACGHSWGG